MEVAGAPPPEDALWPSQCRMTQRPWRLRPSGSMPRATMRRSGRAQGHGASSNAMRETRAGAPI
eukprot:10786383-Lingulodinium_polyedra.AAC.1